MAKRNKLMKFAEMREFPNVFEVFDMKNPVIESQGNSIELKGLWAEKHFKNDKPLCLELACGRGEYSLGLAKLDSSKNYLGVDIKGARIWKGAKTALNENLSNVAFLRTKIELINHFFAPGEVSEIWITFPDPFLSKENRRLTSPTFLDRYKKLLTKQNNIHLKTDSRELYDYTKSTLNGFPGITIHEDNPDIYSNENLKDTLKIKTYYENMHLLDERKITYLHFSIDV